jgi:hypothetical protein
MDNVGIHGLGYLGQLRRRQAPPRPCPVCGFVCHFVRKDHQRGTFHQQHRRLKALLQNPCVTFGEIGKRFGISRERVRQLAKAIGIEPGRKREMFCGLQHQKPIPPLIERVGNLAASRGLDWAPQARKGGGRWRKPWSQRLIIIAGKKCLVALAPRDRLGRRCLRPRYRAADFVVYLLEDAVAVVPSPGLDTITRMPGGKHDRYLNAWHLLKGAEHAAPPEGLLPRLPGVGLSRP